MELENIYWSLFEGSGSVQAYLAYKELCATDREIELNDMEFKNIEYKENDDINL